MVKALIITALSLQQVDSATFQDVATANLYALARQRHVHQDTVVWDYQAVVHTRLEASAGRSRFARQTTLMAHETVARITWNRPNDLRIQVLGTRAKVPLVGMLSGLAAVLLTARLNSAGPNAGIMYELDAIAATVIGGTSLMGGEGTIFGTLIGALIMGVLRNGLNLLGISSYIQDIVIGSVIVLAVLMDMALKKRN